MAPRVPDRYLPVTKTWMATRWEDCETLGLAVEKYETFPGATEDFIGPNVLTAAIPDPHAWMREALDITLRPEAVNAYRKSCSSTVHPQRATAVMPLIPQIVIFVLSFRDVKHRCFVGIGCGRISPISIWTDVHISVYS